jgi:Uma2 family endonuclease
MSPAPNLSHQRVAANLSGCFYINFRKKSCEFFAAPFDVRLPIASAKKDTTIVQPDFCIICDSSKLNNNGCNGAPDLTVEIISPNNSKHDSITKFNLYQEAGVKEYWIIDPIEKILNVYTLQNNMYIGLQPQSEGEKIKSKLFPDINIELNDIFENL